MIFLVFNKNNKYLIDSFVTLLGRFHPLIVHLPIGFLLLGLMMTFYDRKEKKHLGILKFAFLWGAISSLLAVITGLIQYDQEGYQWLDIQLHLILGITTTLLSFVYYFHLIDFIFFKRIPKKLLAFSLLFVLIFTGHLGGNLTHGSDHLTEPIPQGLKDALGMETPSILFELNPKTFRELPLYGGVVRPILDLKCVSCHNKKKSKGELLLNDYKGIVSGGESGEVINFETPRKSLIWKYIRLPLEDEMHMPPKAKTQLTKAEIKVISRWIELGADENKVIRDLGLERSVFTSFFPKNMMGIYPKLEIPLANLEVVENLKDLGINIAPIFKTASFLEVSCVNMAHFEDQLLDSLLLLKDHIVYLDLGKTKITDSIFSSLEKFQYLTVLKLDNTEITGKGIEKLSRLIHLKQINLTNTNLDFEILPVLFSFPALTDVFIFQKDKVDYNSDNIPKNLKGVFEFGNYKVDAIPSDKIVF